MTGRILQNGNVIEVRQGDNFNIRLQFKKQGKEIDLTGADVKMQVKNPDNGQVMWTLSGQATDIEQGKFLIPLTPIQTGIAVGTYTTDIQIQFNDELKSIHTIFPADVNKTGYFRVTPQVTE
ncbi:MAG: BppU family phage baseplate upper protein [Bacteroidales bacterium]|nr:BppU family phage baseplate upper protein [Candidatus Scybalousia scybalohippi]